MSNIHNNSSIRWFFNITNLICCLLPHFPFINHHTIQISYTLLAFLFVIFHCHWMFLVASCISTMTTSTAYILVSTIPSDHRSFNFWTLLISYNTSTLYKTMCRGSAFNVKHLYFTLLAVDVERIEVDLTLNYWTFRHVTRVRISWSISVTCKVYWSNTI